MTAAAGPLAGLRVVDFTIMIAGPYASRLLADQDALVIKVESPTGDPMRQRTPLREGVSSYFGAMNAGKQSVVLDLKHAEDRQRALDMVAEADVVVENFRPGVMAKLGLDYATCTEVNPRLVYCSISGYGQEGPKAGYPAYAPILHAVSGYDLANMGYQRDAVVPASTGTFVADVMAGQAAYGAIVTALLARSGHGRGDHLDVALLDTMLSTLVYETQAAQADGSGAGKTVYRPARVGDEFVVIAAITDRNFRALIGAMDRPDLLHDQRFADMSGRERHWEEWQDLVAAWAADQDIDELERLLFDRGVPCSRFRSVKEALEDEQLQSRGTLRTAEDTAGRFRYIGPPFRSSVYPPSNKPAPVPALGQHEAPVFPEQPTAEDRLGARARN